MSRFSLINTAVAGSLLFTLAACGGGSDEPSEAAVQEELSAGIQETGATKEQGDCFAKILIDEVGLEEMQDVDLTADEPPPGMEEDLKAATDRAIEECLDAETSPSSSTDSGSDMDSDDDTN
ncbi:MAG: hypothetical protein EXQ71_07860 [Acidimicrobiia bacterium]|nr:hypothetical protein [Acidimicrobiia bacterium]